MSVTPYVAPPQTTPWVPLWPLGGQTLGELAYAEATADVSVTGAVEASAMTIVTAPAVVMDGATPILVEFYSNLVGTAAVAGATIVLWLFDNGVSIGRISYTQSPASAAAYTPARVARRLTPSAGSHVYSIRATVSTGTGVVSGNVGGVGTPMPAFIRVTLASPISNAPAGAVLPVQYGTTLPVGPVDGQEAILVDSLTAPTYQWRMRYNALASGANKWEFIGGSPWISYVAANQALSGAWVSSTPTVTIPRSGEWLVSHGGLFNGSGTFYLGLYLGGVLQDPGIARTAGPSPEVALGRSFMPFTFVAGNVLTLACYGSGGVVNRQLTLQPARIS